MTTAVRLFAYEGVVAMPLANPNAQLATNGAFVLKEPYMATAAITASGSPQSTDVSLSPAGCAILRIEVQKGKVIHYEITRQNVSPVTATTNSPTLEGKDNLHWGPGMTISIIEAGSEA
jgi:hypothetical protein